MDYIKGKARKIKHISSVLEEWSGFLRLPIKILENLSENIRTESAKSRII